MVAMSERNHMAYHDGTTDQAYLDATQEIHQMAMEDSREANLVLDDTAMEIQWYKDMDESMEPAPGAWSRYWHHHPRPSGTMEPRCRCNIQQHHPHSRCSSSI
jgi:hypothetical protein